MDSITHRLWSKAVSKLENKSVNLSKISKLTQVRVATLWTYHHGKARWTADLWLKVMLLTGIAQISENQLIIPLGDLVEDFQKWQFSTDVFKPKKVRGDLNEDRHELEVGTVQEL